MDRGQDTEPRRKEGRKEGSQGRVVRRRRASTGRKTLRERARERGRIIRVHASRCTLPRRFTALGKGKWRYRQSAEQFGRARAGQGSHSLLTPFQLRVVGRPRPVACYALGAGRAWKLKVDRSRGARRRHLTCRRSVSACRVRVEGGGWWRWSLNASHSIPPVGNISPPEGSPCPIAIAF